MERISEPEGTHSWVCKVCKKHSHDKTRIRKHVKNKHLQKNEKDEKVEEKYNLEKETVFESEDIEEKALGLMERMSEPEGTHSWVCKVCKKHSHDKTRIRKHVKSKHLQNNAKDEKVEEKYDLEKETVFENEDIEEKALG